MNPITGSTCRAKCSNILHDKTTANIFQSLEEQVRWKELEHKNELESKDSKILELRQNLTVNSEIQRLQAECKRLYELTKCSTHKTFYDLNLRILLVFVLGNLFQPSPMFVIKAWSFWST
jgi:hypothetical protein